MLKNILTGGIDLPKLSTEVAKLRLSYEETNTALADHIASAHTRLSNVESLVASRALAQDVETLRLKLNRLDGEIGNVTFGDRPKLETGFTPSGLSGVVADLSDRVASLTKQVEALTAAKLSEVKSRKKPPTK